MKVMKRKSIILLAVIAFCVSSCNFLNLSDPDAFDTTKFYRDSADLEGLLASAYAGLRPAYDKLFFVTEMKSDNAYTNDMGTAGGKYYTFVSHTVTSQNDIVADIYNAFYFCIHRSNLVLEHLDAVQMSDAERNRLKGEALYLRALSHFYLTRLWGQVTIMRHTITGNAEAIALRRSPVEDVYAFIIDDLKAVADADWLPANCTGSQFGHASHTAACALLGRVYLQEAATLNKPELYPNAITYLEKAITISGYTGFDKKYTELFTLEGQNDAEVIFPIMYMANAAEGSNFAQYFQPQGAIGITSALSGRGFNLGQENLYQEFEYTQNGFPKNDRIRRTKAIREYTDGTYYTLKYVDLNPAGFGGNIWFEIRFADVYLMLAEAYERVEGNTSAKAISYLDKVRKRPSSSLDGYEDMQSEAAYTTAYPTLRDAIFHERRVELCFENQRWFDLMRLYPNADDFVAYMHSVQEPNVGNKYSGFQKYELLLPIPYDEWFLNKDLGQNDGY